MSRRALFVAALVTTGCSAILGFQDGKLSPGLANDLCDTTTSDPTPCQQGFGCFAKVCYANCPSDTACASGTRCLPVDGTGGTNVPTACVPFDRASCRNAPCAGNDLECVQETCRQVCDLASSSSGGTGRSCHVGEVCIAEAGQGRGHCYAASEQPDGSTPAGGATGQDLWVFGGASGGPITLTPTKAYFVIDSTIWSCARSGCTSATNGARSISQGNAPPKFLATYDGSRVAWAAPNGGVQRCFEQPGGGDCMIETNAPFPFATTQFSSLEGFDTRLYWLSTNNLDVALNAFKEGDSGGTPPRVAGIQAAGSVDRMGHHPISAEQHLVSAGGQIFQLLSSGAAAVPISSDGSTFNHKGLPLITHGADRAVWVAEATEKRRLFQCHIDLGKTQVCVPGEWGLFYDYTNVSDVVVSGLSSTGPAIVWAEYSAQSGYTNIRACSPAASFVGAACDNRVVTAEANVPGRVTSLVAGGDGYLYYMLAYNSASAKNGANFSLRRVKFP